jgi:hypothetical protein
MKLKDIPSGTVIKLIGSPTLGPVIVDKTVDPEGTQIRLKWPGTFEECSGSFPGDQDVQIVNRDKADLSGVWPRKKTA